TAACSFQGNIDIKIIGNNFYCGGNRTQIAFSSLNSGTIEVNNNSFSCESATNAPVIFQNTPAEIAGIIYNINKNSFNTSFEAIKITGGTQTNPIELNITRNYIKSD